MAPRLQLGAGLDDLRIGTATKGGPMGRVLLIAMLILSLPLAAEAAVLAYSLSVTDFEEPSTFSFTFSIPFLPISGPTVVSSTLSGTLTDAGTDGVSISPALADLDGDGIAEVATGSVGGGGPDVNMGVDLGLASALAGAYGPFAEGPQPGPGPGPWTTMTVTVAFQLSGGGDQASLSGSFTIEPDPAPVPEPGALWLLGAGVGMLALARRRGV